MTFRVLCTQGLSEVSRVFSCRATTEESKRKEKSQEEENTGSQPRSGLGTGGSESVWGVLQGKKWPWHRGLRVCVGGTTR